MGSKIWLVKLNLDEKTWRILIFLFNCKDPNNSNCVFGGYKSGNLCAFDLRNSTMFFKHQLVEGICNIDIIKDEKSENRTLLAVSPKGKYSIFHLQDINEVSLPLVASMAIKNLSFSSATIWCGSYCNSSNYFMTTTNDGYLSLHKQFVYILYYLFYLLF